MSEQLDLLARAHSRRDELSLDRWVDRLVSERAAIADDHAPGRRPPRARGADPESSHRAADEIEASGAIGEQQRFALDAIRSFPGHSTRELAQLTDPPKGMDATQWRYALGRRVTELADRGLVERRLKRNVRDDVRIWPAGSEIPASAGDRVDDARRRKAS